MDQPTNQIRNIHASQVEILAESVPVTVVESQSVEGILPIQSYAHLMHLAKTQTQVYMEPSETYSTRSQ